MPPPSAITCHLCSKKFFKHSFPIHLKKCEEIWRKTHERCQFCGIAVSKFDWNDHRKHCNSKTNKNNDKSNKLKKYSKLIKNKPLTPPKPFNDSINIGSNIIKDCDECETEKSEWKCNECEQYLCISCEIELHKKGSRIKHERIPLTMKALMNPINLNSIKNMDNNGDNIGSGSGVINDGRMACKFCGRKFNMNRVEKHQRICKDVGNKKRKKWDSEEKRLEGTDFIKYKYHRSATPEKVKYWKKYSRRWRNESKSYQEYLKEKTDELKTDDVAVLPRMNDKNGKVLCTEMNPKINVKPVNIMDDDSKKIDDKKDDKKINSNIVSKSSNDNKGSNIDSKDDDGVSEKSGKGKRDIKLIGTGKSKNVNTNTRKPFGRANIKNNNNNNNNNRGSKDRLYNANTNKRKPFSGGKNIRMSRSNSVQSSEVSLDVQSKSMKFNNRRIQGKYIRQNYKQKNTKHDAAKNADKVTYTRNRISRKPPIPKVNSIRNRPTKRDINTNNNVIPKRNSSTNATQNKRNINTNMTKRNNANSHINRIYNARNKTNKQNISKTNTRTTIKTNNNAKEVSKDTKAINNKSQPKPVTKANSIQVETSIKNDTQKISKHVIKKMSPAHMLKRGQDLGKNVELLDGKAKSLQDYMEREKLRKLKAKRKFKNSM